MFSNRIRTPDIHPSPHRAPCFTVHDTSCVGVRMISNGSESHWDQPSPTIAYRKSSPDSRTSKHLCTTRQSGMAPCSVSLPSLHCLKWSALPQSHRRRRVLSYPSPDRRRGCFFPILPTICGEDGVVRHRDESKIEVHRLQWTPDK